MFNWKAIRAALDPTYRTRRYRVDLEGYYGRVQKHLNVPPYYLKQTESRAAVYITMFDEWRELVFAGCKDDSAAPRPSVKPWRAPRPTPP
jgi:hypothetical protein